MTLKKCSLQTRVVRSRRWDQLGAHPVIGSIEVRIHVRVLVAGSKLTVKLTSKFWLGRRSSVVAKFRNPTAGFYVLRLLTTLTCA